MIKTLYSPIRDKERSPFDGSSAPQDRHMTFRIQDRSGTRFDLAVVDSGLAGRIKWLWPGHIPLGRVTLIEGPGSSGKSFLTQDLAARLSDDRPWPDGTPQAHPGSKALILCRQDDSADVVGARLQALGAQPERCLQFHEFETVDDEETCFENRPLSLPLDFPALERLLDSDKTIRLVVIDPLSDFCSGKKVLAEVLHRLNRLVSDRRVAIVVTLRADCKFNRDGKLVVKSRYDTAAGRVQWCCVPDPEEPGRHLFLPTLMNYTALPAGRTYRLGDLHIAWDEATVDPLRPLKSEDACDTWLRELLEPAALPATEIMRLGRELGFSDSKINRTRKRIGATILPPEMVNGKRKSYWSTGKGRSPDVVEKLQNLQDEYQKQAQSPDFDKLGDEPLRPEEIPVFFPGHDIGEGGDGSDADGDDAAAIVVAAAREAVAKAEPVKQQMETRAVPPSTGAAVGTTSSAALKWLAGQLASRGKREVAKGDDNEPEADWEEIEPASFPASDAEADRILNEQPHVALKETDRSG